MEDIVNRNNQAGRLHKLLSEAEKLSDNAATIEVWASVFGVNSEDKITIFRQFIAMQEIADNIKHIITKMPNVNSRLLLSQHHKIDRVVKATNLDAHWANYKKFLDSTVLINLAHCAEALSPYDENPVEQDALTDLLKEVSDLTDKVGTKDLDGRLKTIVQDLLEAIRRSIIEYKIRGANGVREELAYCYGKVIQNYQIFKDNETTEEVASLWKIFARADNLTTVALNLVSIGTTAINLLAICHK